MGAVGVPGEPDRQWQLLKRARAVLYCSPSAPPPDTGTWTPTRSSRDIKTSVELIWSPNLAERCFLLLFQAGRGKQWLRAGSGRAQETASLSQQLWCTILPLNCSPWRLGWNCGMSSTLVPPQVPEQVLPCSPWRPHSEAGTSWQPTARSEITHWFQSGGQGQTSCHHLETHPAAEATRSTGWSATVEAAGQQNPSNPAIWGCARVLGTHRAPMWGHPTPANLEVTAETLQCRPGPLLLLLAQPDFQEALADPPRSGLPVQKWIHMFCPQQASVREYHRPGLTTEIPYKSVLNFVILGEESPRTVLKTQKMSFKTWWLLSKGFGTLSWHEQQAIIKSACLTDADSRYLLIYNHVYFYLVCIYIYLCLFTSHLFQRNVNLPFRLLVIALWLTVLLCSMLSWCLVLHFSSWFGFLISCYLLCDLSKIVYFFFQMANTAESKNFCPWRIQCN